ncbi:insulin receptor-like isoform X2 [Euwallacea fornicatus]|uniref:insulin receptor-like isoform X2 n=1 Tax=Euwallacea fornicatus TaxID=995702 RepID=UPI00338D4CA0
MLKNCVIFGATLFCLGTLLIPVSDAETCTRDIDVRNFVRNLEVLRNCTEIIGNLSIVLLQNTKSVHDYDDYVFPELHRISGYVILYRVKHLTSLGQLFPNLRMIRGVDLLAQENVVLSVYDLPSMREIGTTKLSYIGRGYVKMGKVPNLCFANTVDWKRIGADSFVQYQEYRDDCPACPAHCGGYCWNENTCQVFTDHCHEECLGCSKNNSNAHCDVCKNFDNGGVCVPECPPDKYLLYLYAQCVTKKECLDRNKNQPEGKGRRWFVHNKTCVSGDDCPRETQFNNETFSCERCVDNLCIQHCGSAKLTDRITIENMEKCTHINGSLSIMNLKNGDERELLYDSLKYVRYIRDYLLIARNEVIEDLDFLPQLAEIGGSNRYLTKSLMVFENRKLRSLWSNQSIKIRNGSIAFHDNDRLCLSEIENFAKNNGIKYNESDVSKYSNGDECSESFDSKLVDVQVIKINPYNATIIWNLLSDDSVFYYTVHYIEYALFNMTIRSQDVCTSERWSTLSTRNNSVVLVELKPYKIYSYYIQVYYSNMTTKKTLTMQFNTSQTDPEYATNILSATSLNDTAIQLKWEKPTKTHGELQYYAINVYGQLDDPEYIWTRDYCIYPFSREGENFGKFAEMIDPFPALTHKEKLAVFELGPPEKTSPDPPCNATSEETNIRLEDNVWLYLCDNKSQSKFGIDYCRNYYYDLFSAGSNDSDGHVQKRDTKSSLLKKRSDYFSLKIDNPDTTSLVLNNLTQFTMYVIYFMACNKDIEMRKLCGPVLQVTVRTKKNVKADQITDLTVENVNNADVMIRWTPPKDVNAVLLAYYVYHGQHRNHSNNAKSCITHPQFMKNKNLTLRGIPPGSYFITVQAVSLGGVGNYSQTKLVDITVSKFGTIWIILGLIFFGIFGILVSFAYYRIQMKRRESEDNQLVPCVNPDYEALSYELDEWEMDRDDIQLYNIIGQGAFGRVFSGNILSRDLKCAVKTVNEETSREDNIKFLKEASVMKVFTNGAHVIKLLGVVSKSQPPLVVMELMEKGDLKRYLLKFKNEGQTLTSNEIYRMSIEIADGLAYLVSRKFVHRDLATRNCMVSSDMTVKIGDFGLTRDTYQSDYYKKGSGSALLPVRWMAPEAIADGVNTYDSDIWSYGIVLWEIVTLASQPYPGLSNEQVTQFVVSKKTLDRPSGCPNLLWEIMRKCWDWYPTRRPTCFEVIDSLQEHVGRNFQAISFYHSTIGQEYLMSQGGMRSDNPPAVGIGEYDIETSQSSGSDPPSSREETDSSERAIIDVDFIPPSSHQESSSPTTATSAPSSSTDLTDRRPLMSQRSTDSDLEHESQL